MKVETYRCDECGVEMTLKDFFRLDQINIMKITAAGGFPFVPVNGSKDNPTRDFCGAPCLITWIGKEISNKFHTKKISVTEQGEGGDTDGLNVESYRIGGSQPK